MLSRDNKTVQSKISGYRQESERNARADRKTIMEKLTCEAEEATSRQDSSQIFHEIAKTTFQSYQIYLQNIEKSKVVESKKRWKDYFQEMFIFNNLRNEAQIKVAMGTLEINYRSTQCRIVE